MQKNANIFIFFATPSGLSSFFAFLGLAIRENKGAFFFAKRG